MLDIVWHTCNFGHDSVQNVDQLHGDLACTAPKCCQACVQVYDGLAHKLGIQESESTTNEFVQLGLLMAANLKSLFEAHCLEGPDLSFVRDLALEKHKQTSPIINKLVQSHMPNWLLMIIKSEEMVREASLWNSVDDHRRSQTRTALVVATFVLIGELVPKLRSLCSN